MTTPAITIDTKVEECQALIDEVRTSTKLDIVQRVKLTTMLQNNQFKAVALKLAVIKAMRAVPDRAPATVPMLGTPIAADPVSQPVKQ